jgi:hypothetical protein
MIIAVQAHERMIMAGISCLTGIFPAILPAPVCLEDPADPARLEEFPDPARLEDFPDPAYS